MLSLEGYLCAVTAVLTLMRAGSPARSKMRRVARAFLRRM